MYPDGLLRIPGATLWSIFFFPMIFTLGIDSMVSEQLERDGDGVSSLFTLIQFGLVETVATAVVDFYPEYRQKRTSVIVSVCAVLFMLGLPLCTNGGTSWPCRVVHSVLHYIVCFRRLLARRS